MEKEPEQFEVVLKSDTPLFVLVYHTFLESNLLDGKEKIIFIILKKFLTIGKEQGKVYPKLETICKYAGMSKKTVIKIIKSLQEKGILKVEQRGLNKPNLYTLRDYSQMWEAQTAEEMTSIVDEIEVKQMIETLTAKGYYISKEKELASNSGQTIDTSTYKKSFYVNKDTTDSTKSQVERYTINDIKVLYDYDGLLTRFSDKKSDIDAVIDILYDTLNTTKQSIRIASEDKPAMTVIGKLMRLEPDDLIYSIDKYHEQTERVKNVKSYLLTILYNAKEQRHLDISNLGHHNGDF